MFKLRPELILIFHIIVQLHMDNHHPVFTLGVGLSLFNLLVAEYILFKRFSHLLFHLCRRSTGVHSYNQTLPYCKGWKLLFGHFVQCINTKQYQHRHKQNYNLPVPHSQLYNSCLLTAHLCSIFIPSLIFCIPSTTTLSPADTAPNTSTPLADSDSIST